MLVFLSLFTGCAEEPEFLAEEDASPGESEMMTVFATAGMPLGVDTRLAYEEVSGGGDAPNNLSVTWREFTADYAEKFTVLDVKEGNDSRPFYTFSLIERADNPHLATFKGGLPNGTKNGTALYAFYPALANGKDEVGYYAPAQAMPMDLSTQSGILNNDTKTYMYAKTTYETDKEITFSFHHLTAMVKLVLTFPEGVSTITDLTFNATDMYNRKNVDLTTDPVTYSGTHKDPIPLTGTFAVTNSHATAYICLFPGELLKDIVISAKGKDDEVSYSGTLPEATLTAGTMYTANVEMK